MVAPTKSFSVIPDADVDPDSPLTTDLMTALRDNDLNLFSQLVGEPVGSPPYTPAQAHDHDGSNSKQIATTWQHVETKEIDTAVQSYTFSGLDGNAAKFYLLRVRIKTDHISGTTNPYQLRINASAAAADIFTIIPSLSVLEVGASWIKIWTPATVQSVGLRRFVYAQGLNGTHATPVLTNYPGVWEDTTTNITSLQIYGSGSVQPQWTLGVGSSMSLYKLGEV